MPERVALPPASASMAGTFQRWEKYVASSGFPSGVTRKTMVSRLSLPASSLSGTLTSYPPWNLRSKPSIGLMGVTVHGTSLRISLASRIAASDVNSRTEPPGPEVGISTCALTERPAARHVHARISAILAHRDRIIRQGIIAIGKST